MSKLTFVYKKEGSLFGVRYFIKVIKECNNFPGFAPETFDIEVCEIVKEFKDKQNYTQFFGSSVPAIELIEWEEILDRIKETFDESKHQFDKK